MPAIEVDRDRAREFIEGKRRDHLQKEALNDHKQEKIQEQLENADSDPNSWKTLTDKAAEIIAARVCPAWEVNEGERDMWSGAAAESLDRYFPGALEGFDNWHPIAKLIGATCVIAATRIDFENGGFAPLHHNKKETDNANGEPERRTLNINQRQEPERENNSSYSTIGE